MALHFEVEVPKTSFGIHLYRVRRNAQREYEGWEEKLAENIPEVSGKIKGEEPVKETDWEGVSGQRGTRKPGRD